MEDLLMCSSFESRAIMASFASPFFGTAVTLILTVSSSNQTISFIRARVLMCAVRIIGVYKVVGNGNQLVVNHSIGSNKVVTVNIPRISTKICNNSSSFLNEKCTRQDIPKSSTGENNRIGLGVCNTRKHNGR